METFCNPLHHGRNVRKMCDRYRQIFCIVKIDDKITYETETIVAIREECYTIGR